MQAIQNEIAALIDQGVRRPSDVASLVCAELGVDLVDVVNVMQDNYSVRVKGGTETDFGVAVSQRYYAAELVRHE